MLIDEIRKANIEAMKERDPDKRSAYSGIITRYQNLASSGSNKEITDADIIHIISKYCKELDEEKEGYLKANRLESAACIDRQKAALEPFLPKLLSEEEIRNIIASLEDKSIPYVMNYFKTNYPGQADLGLVSKIIRQG